MASTQLILNQQKILNNVNFIMLDKDGTLIDAHHYWLTIIELRAMEITNRYFIHHSEKTLIAKSLESVMGVDHKLKKLKSTGPVGIKHRSIVAETIRMFLIEKYNLIISNEEIETCFKTIDKKTENNLSPLLKLLPGVKNFLSSCKQFPIQLAIVSSDITPRIIAMLKALHMEHFFDYIVGGDCVKEKKPHPESIELALQLSQSSPEQSVMIGDHTVDIEMGLKTALACNIAVTTGLLEKKDFLPFNCHIVSTLEELSFTR